MIDSTWVTSFTVFADELNFTRAAKRLHLSQPSLHVQISKLAETLGVSLYERNGRNLSLTRQGEVVLRFARDVGTRHEALLADLAEVERAPRITLVAGTGALLYVLGPAISDIQRRGEALLRVMSRDAVGAMDAVISGRAHAGVAALDTVPEELESTILTHSSLRVALPSGHALTRKRRIGPRDLEGETLILPPTSRPHRQSVERLLEAEGVTWRLGLEASGWELMLRYATLRIGLALVNDICVLPKGLVSRPFVGVPPISYRWIEPRSKATPPAPLHALKAAVMACFKNIRR